MIIDIGIDSYEIIINKILWDFTSQPLILCLENWENTFSQSRGRDEMDRCDIDGWDVKSHHISFIIIAYYLYYVDILNFNAYSRLKGADALQNSTQVSRYP